MTRNPPWPPQLSDSRPVLLQYGSLPAEARATWEEAARQLGVQVIQTERFDECLLHAAGARPVCLVMPISEVEAGGVEAARIMNSADPAFRRFTVVLLAETIEQADRWGRIAWDAILGSSSMEQVELTLAASIETARLRLKDQALVDDYYHHHANLTPEEIVILEAVCAGRLNKQIARELKVSIRTVEQRRRRVFEKMGVESAIPLAAQVATVHTMEHQGTRRNLPAIPPAPAAAPPAPHMDLRKTGEATTPLPEMKAAGGEWPSENNR